MPLPILAGLSSIAVRAGTSAGGAVLQSFIGGGGRGKIVAKIKWHGPQVEKNIKKGMSRRIKLAAQMTRDQVVRNIRRPVTKVKGPISKRVQVVPESRSKKGEFPKLDTGRLSKDVYWEMRGEMDAVIGTTLDYGLVLETKMNRSFLRRTLTEMRPTINRILSSGPRLPGQV